MAKGKAPTHHSAFPGKRVIAVLRNGTIVRGKVQEKNDRFLLIEECPRIPWKDVVKFRVDQPRLQQNEGV